jgi:cellulose synthase/poly-beta-1,6-N-acetylglucosamine synthase-like glycosyltransferase
MTPPAVTVIVPAYNAAATLPETLSALAAQTFDKALLEVIVVDDGSTDATAAVAAAHGARVIRQENRGPAAARNAGATAATGDILVFTDADCTPLPDFVAQLVRPFADPAVAGVQGAYRTRQTGLVARFAQLEFEDRYRYAARFPSLDLVATYAAAFRREVFLAAGGFDTSFPVADNEDTEFSYRLCRAGHRLAFAPRAMVYHRHPVSLPRYLHIKTRRAYWRMAACREHPDKILRDGYTPGLLRAQTGLAGLCGLGLVSWPVVRSGGWLALATGIALAASAIPFTRFAWQRDPAVAVVAPGIVCARAFAFALGAGLAVLSRLTGRSFCGKRTGAKPCG